MQPAGDAEAVHPRQRDIEHDDVRVVLEGLLQRLVAVVGFSTDFPSRMLLDNAADTTPDELVIISNQNFQHGTPL
jgi:hypothetical protein